MRLAVIIAAAALLTLSSCNTARKPSAAPPAAQSIDIAFVLDTTASMQDVIDGAKTRIWSVATAITSKQPKPHVRIALLPFRDRGDAYVTQLFDLTDDLDAVFKNLQSFKAEGGGDTPESVNQALYEAVTKVSWSADPNAVKLIFLVGDAPPHMDYADDVKYPDTCKLAVERHISVNTIQCGDIDGAAPVFQEIAGKATGSYVPLPADGGDMRLVSSPVDGDLAELNARLNQTVLPYGSAAQQASIAAKLVTSESIPAAVAADRLTYNLLDNGKVVQGTGDLLTDLSLGRIAQSDLDSLPQHELPPTLQNLTSAERSIRIRELQSRRAAVQQRIADLLRKRTAYLAAHKSTSVGNVEVPAETSHLSDGPVPAMRQDAFDQQVIRMVNDAANR